MEKMKMVATRLCRGAIKGIVRSGGAIWFREGGALVVHGGEDEKRGLMMVMCIEGCDLRRGLEMEVSKAATLSRMEEELAGLMAAALVVARLLWLLAVEEGGDFRGGDKMLVIRRRTRGWRLESHALMVAVWCGAAGRWWRLTALAARVSMEKVEDDAHGLGLMWRHMVG
ncbi:hypothetical protein LR48_Vigan10g135300 [Vigna angularis]|uniref:Uncharacterized protein n=1 Tax=Phaseolus angularis TaxID=3914 RepID=A0A0L9VKA4_PHAAN|nr:hypothetical protein LR48_Vigan10g135300 [Vigna angularis]